METKTQVLNLNHEDLADLFSTAFYDNPNFSVSIPESAMNLIEHDENDCFEDTLAKVAMAAKATNGKPMIYDQYSEDGEVYGNNAYGVADDGEYETTYYYIGIKEIIKGLEAAANSDEQYIRDAFESFKNREDDSEWDAARADILMQMIVFGEVIY
jgi:hypothetical protein